jgi:hypothetical protein
MMDASNNWADGYPMDVQLWLASQLSRALAAWQALDSNAQVAVWWGAGAVGVIVWAWLAYWLLRRLAGHRRFRSRWFTEAEYHRLMQVLWEDQQEGARVMSHAELAALREYKYGGTVKPLLARKGGGYFDG